MPSPTLFAFDAYGWFTGLAGPWFLNPGSLLAGLLLMAAPIIIHLINRMRYRRVRWAAMEFLLKAQKRMKRKMIVEQLILLLLRILLMLLLGILIARFFGFDSAGSESRATHHVVLIDDSPSMADANGKEDDGAKSAYTIAKSVLLDQICPATSQSTTPQSMDVLLMSDLSNPIHIDRISTASTEEIRTKIGTEKISNVRVDLATALKKAEERLAAAPGTDTARVLHIMTDLRSADWQEQGPAVKLAVEKLTKAGVKVHFLDAAAPFRKAGSTAAPLHSENVGILDLRPSKQVVARHEAVEFSLTVKNFGVSELKDVRFSIRINGDVKTSESKTFPSLPPGEEKTIRFDISFDKSGSPDNIFEGRTAGTRLTEDEKGGFKKVFDRFALVTAVLETDEPGGIAADNVRHTMVEVRERLPILAIDGDPVNRDKPEGNSFFVQKQFESSPDSGYRWVPGKIEMLADEDLSKYAFILLFNVPTLPENGAKALENYCANGGGVGFFLGDAVKPQDYNKLLYRDGAGLFPVPLPDKPTDPPPEDAENLVSITAAVQKKLLMRNPALQRHPGLSVIYTDDRGEPFKNLEPIESGYRFMKFNRYWPVRRAGKWVEDGRATELYCLPNMAKPGQYEALIHSLADKLPDGDAAEAKYKDILAKLKGELKNQARTAAQLADIVAVFDQLLSDQSGGGDANETLLREFWALPRHADLRTEFTRMRDLLKYGDPIYVAQNFGRGCVTAFLTNINRSADSRNDWSDIVSGPAGAGFVPLNKGMGNYLSSGGTAERSHSGDAISFRFPADRYDAKYYVAMMTHEGTKGRAQAQPGTVEAAPIRLADQFEAMAADKEQKDRIALDFTATRAPGVYIFGFEQKRPNPANATETISVPEFRMVPVNIDPREGDLRRSASEDVISNAVGSEIHGPDDRGWIEKLKNKRDDLSEAGWMFLAFLVLLLLEQTMAVRLSYHAAPDTLAGRSPTAAAAMRQTMSRATEPTDAA